MGLFRDVGAGRFFEFVSAVVYRLPKVVGLLDHRHLRCRSDDRLGRWAAQIAGLARLGFRTIGRLAHAKGEGRNGNGESHGVES